MGGKCHYFGKPHEEHFYACLRELNLEHNSSHVAHVGDSLHHDIAGANAAGLSSIFVTGGIHSGYFDGLGYDCSIGEIPKRDDLISLFDSEKEEDSSPSGIFPTHVMPLFRL